MMNFNLYLDKAIKRTVILAITFLLVFSDLYTKSFPGFMQVSENGKQLQMRKTNAGTLYDLSKVVKVYLTFSEANYWNILKSNYISDKELAASMTIDGMVYDSVGVKFRGQTSYNSVKNSQKYSFNISVDYAKPDQRVMGYKTLNLNNCFDDASFMKEVLYNDLSGNFIPSASASYVNLYINNVNWGVYVNLQQLNRDFYDDWFLSSDGSSWRAEYPDTSSAKPKPGPGANPFGLGVCSLNDLGEESIVYQKYYTLKSSKKENPWEDLAIACQKLNQLPTDQLYDSLKYYIDVDRCLWHIAVENAFGDDDGYINKGGMDYYVYWDAETKRITPIEFDGNSSFLNKNISWTPFHKISEMKLPLINKLFSSPELKQRYVAHYRTILDQAFQNSIVDPKINNFRKLIDSLVKADTKKLYSYTSFNSTINDITNFVKIRKSTILKDANFIAEYPIVSQVVHTSQSNNIIPKSGEKVRVSVSVKSNIGIKAVYLYYGTGLMGVFQKAPMSDNGNQFDGEANDGVYGAEIPAFDANTYVRYYIEAISTNSLGTASFSPEGAEHDVYFYQVQSAITAEKPSLVINEVMASNSSTISDPQGEFDDWIEILNTGAVEVDLSGRFLSDKADNFKKWQFPDNTKIQAGEYLLVWADENGKATPGLHTNFKLSASGEVLFLIDSDANGNQIIDSVSFGFQETDISTGRYPNATGTFTRMTPSPGAYNNNNLENINDNIISSDLLSVYPMPFSDKLLIEAELPDLSYCIVEVLDLQGNLVNKLYAGYPSLMQVKLEWNGLNSNGDEPPNAYYMLKIQSGTNVIVKEIIKMKY